ncbi:Transforming growth factor-beta receptor-associated protein 1 [Psilocybe cubensis]|uniref:Transforming growth factor-beta receptor-associated protein 1 n=2 Tax=Psilocybe cubensis TaxID=181762 RepID=A0ACB8GTP3_PSICU|nr:Transforming growth factor-beta receptor-associated protein 1 [Psilocybe cubensis]KAH9478601.1 Transforming growth factor-beta receptor-associated protein 1 [Psilocybe cubensis]
MMRPPVFPRSSVLVLGPNSIQSLVPSTIISQLESLLESHRLDDSYALADQRRKKLEESLEPDEDEAEELRYVYQRIGFQCFTETLFEDAGKHLFNGEIDPRLLISYYPDLRGSLFSEDDAMDVFAGVAEHMPMEGSVDQIIVSNLVRNYSPHLAPDTLSAPPTAELRKILGMAARDMLLVFLKKNRTRRSLLKENGVGSTGDPIDIAIDTVLVKLYAEFEKTQELYALLEAPNDVALTEVEPALQSKGQYNALCILYKQRGDDLKVIEVLSKLVDGEWSDDDIKDPLGQMVNLLTEKRDRALTQQWGLWITKRNPDMGLKLLMPRDIGKRREKPEEDIALLEEIQKADPAAGVQYLEYLVLQRWSTSRELHLKLALACVDQVLSFLKDDTVAKLWRAKAASYSSSHNQSSFLSYFASTTPESGHKRARLKNLLFLAGSSLYDPELVRQRLTEQEKILKFELAIIDGKLGRHRSALQILVHGLNDSTSAETYCTLGGDIVPPKVAQSIADDNNLQDWTAVLFGSPSTKAVNGRGVGAVPLTRLKTVNEDLKKELLKILLEVYMDVGQSDLAAQLLNAQAMNLDVLDVISMVPPKWPVNMMNSFLSRSFRRTLHVQQEGKIIKNISAGQNLEVKDRTWDILREEGAVIEEEAEDEEGSDEDDGPQSFDEKKMLAEQVAMRLVPGLDPNVVKSAVQKSTSPKMGVDDLR